MLYFSVALNDVSGSNAFYADAGGFTGSVGGIFKNVSGTAPNSIVVVTRNVADGTPATCSGRLNFRAGFRDGSSS